MIVRLDPVSLRFGGKAFSCLAASFLVCALASGCVQKQSSVPSAPAEAAAPSGDAFALALSRMQVGEEALMPTPFGMDSRVMLESSYTSGLGQTCRRAAVRAGGITHRIAVCRDASGWTTAEPIFETVQR